MAATQFLTERSLFLPLPEKQQKKSVTILTNPTNTLYFTYIYIVSSANTSSERTRGHDHRQRHYNFRLFVFVICGGVCWHCCCCCYLSILGETNSNWRQIRHIFRPMISDLNLLCGSCVCVFLICHCHCHWDHTQAAIGIKCGKP